MSHTRLLGCSDDKLLLAVQSQDSRQSACGGFRRRHHETARGHEARGPGGRGQPRRPGLRRFSRAGAALHDPRAPGPHPAAHPLVNEAYLRLLHDRPAEWQGRAHFFAAASIVMRRILVDHARSRAAAKRPGGKQRVSLDEFMASANPRIEQLLILDEALTRLADWDRRQARLVEMIYFGGLTESEAAAVMGISERTVKRDWRAARAWLQSQLGGTPA